MEVFRYRPLTDFLFKELYYQEIYLATNDELNDPLDLSLRLDYSLRTKSDFLDILSTLVYNVPSFYRHEIKSIKEGLKSSKFINNYWEIFSDLLKSERDGIVSNTQLRLNLGKSGVLGNINVTSLDSAFDKIEVEAKNLFKHNGVACFSKNRNNFQMWSHYASKHSGICLGYTFEDDYLPLSPKNATKLHGVKYMNDIEHVRYIDCLEYYYSSKNRNGNPQFIKEFERKLLELYTRKTPQWAYEQEYRIIQLSQWNATNPEMRLLHYPLKNLTSVQFGYRTPDSVKERITGIFDILKDRTKFYESHIDGDKVIHKKYIG